ncbi:uncharacterized protein LOC142814278 isoform X1 [Rhipicephalus microplus]|uniref:uncharacterized protein LOC142814278 isoform X1 n=1 Tax=Rhipicephalus microplus TaxID=6941 RepID=UPI003F6B11F0
MSIATRPERRKLERGQRFSDGDASGSGTTTAAAMSGLRNDTQRNTSITGTKCACIVASSQKGISLWTDNDFGCGTVLLCSCPPLLSEAHQRRLPFLKRLPELGFQVELALGLLVRRRQLRRRGWAQAQRLRVPTLPREVLGTLRQVEEISGYLRRSSSNDLRLLTSH